MLPKVIVHNTISMDCSIRNFELDVGLHYQIASRFKPDAHLVGSITAKTGIDLFTEKVPPEQESDFVKPKLAKNDERPFWFIPDSHGVLTNLLHIYRRSNYCKDVIILVSMKTPKSYIEYLQTRRYDFIVAGEEQVEYEEALKLLQTKYQVHTVLTDSGGTLSSLLLEGGLVDEISLLICPVLVGKQGISLFRTLRSEIKLELIETEIFNKDYVWLLYQVVPAV